TKECHAPEWIRRQVAAMDGSEPRVKNGVRALRPPRDASSPDAQSAGAAQHSELRVGQDAAFARELSEAYVGCGRVIAAFSQSMHACTRQAQRTLPIAPGAGIAATHGMHYPIV